MLEITSNLLVPSSQRGCDTTRLDVNALFPAKDRDVPHSEKLLVVCVAFGEIWCAAPLCALSIHKRWRRSGPSMSAAGEGSEERAERLARIEAMLGASALAARAEA